MNNTFKVAIMMFAAAMLTGTNASAQATVASGTCGADGDSLTWVLTSDGVFSVSGVGKMVDYGNSWTMPWYFYRSQIKAVVIEERVTGIGNFAFSYCSGLSAVDIPAGVTSIGELAYAGCSGLSAVVIPAGVMSIGEYAFASCSGLKKVVIADGATALSLGTTRRGSYTFHSCPIDTVYLGRNISFYDRYNGSPFYDRPALREVAIGSLVTAIPSYTFYECGGLTSVDIPAGVTSIGNWAFYRCNGLTSVAIPAGVASIGKGAFYRCRGLSSVAIPAEVASIGSIAFSGCRGLTSISVDTANAHYCSVNGILYSKDMTTLIQCLNSKQGDLTIPAGVTRIEAYAFRGCRELSSVAIPAGVTSIGAAAFAGCSELAAVAIPKEVTSIGSYAFAYCPGLSSVAIPEGVESIGNGAFSNCTSLKSIYNMLPTPQRIRSDVFRDVTLSNVTLYVPEGALSAYREAAVWRAFNVVEMPR
jgi:hypothetical protein